MGLGDGAPARCGPEAVLPRAPREAREAVLLEEDTPGR